MTIIRGIFDTVIYMSLGATICILAVLFLREICRFLKMPKKYICLLWLVVLYRLLCPFVPESNRFGVTVQLPWEREATSVGGMLAAEGQATDGVQGSADIQPVKDVQQTGRQETGDGHLAENFKVQEYSNQGDIQSKTGEVSIKRLEVPHYTLQILAVVWCMGAVAGMGYLVLSYVQTRKRLSTAVRLADNIWQCEGLVTPMVFGIIKPGIYLPLHMKEELPPKAYDAVLLHERTHIRRKDTVFRLLSLVALCLHWFNPFVWLMQKLYAKDQEMACDEYVMLKSDTCDRKEYSTYLLEFSVKQSGIMIPLSFGQSNTEERIKNILRYKKPAIWASAIIIVVLAGAAVLLFSNNKPAELTEDNGVNQAVGEQNGEQTQAAGLTGDGEGQTEDVSGGKENASDNAESELQVWQAGEEFDEGAYISGDVSAIELHEGVRYWVERKLADILAENPDSTFAQYDDIRYGHYNVEEQFEDSSMEERKYTMTFFMVHEGTQNPNVSNCDRIYTTVCRVDFTAEMADLDKDILKVGEIAYSLSGDIEDKETFLQYYIPHHYEYCEIAMDYTFPVIFDWQITAQEERDMKWVDALYELSLGSQLWARESYARLKNPVSACEELLNLTMGGGEVVLDSERFGTFVKYTFADGGYIYLQMYKGGVERYMLEEYPVRYAGEKADDIYTACAYYTAEEMLETQELNNKVNALSVEKLRGITEVADHAAYTVDRPGEWFVVAEDKKQDTAIYGDGANSLIAVRMGDAYEVFKECWSGMHGSGAKLKTADYDKDGNKEALYVIHLGTGTGFSVDCFYAVDKDAQGAFKLYEYDFYEDLDILYERVTATFYEETCELTVFIDGEEMEQKAFVDTPSTAYKGLAFGDIVDFSPSETEENLWYMTILIGTAMEDVGPSVFSDADIQVEIFYEGDGIFTMGDITYLIGE